MLMIFTQDNETLPLVLTAVLGGNTSQANQYTPTPSFGYQSLFDRITQLNHKIHVPTVAELQWSLSLRRIMKAQNVPRKEIGRVVHL